jgi:hypothetical protein
MRFREAQGAAMKRRGALLCAALFGLGVAGCEDEQEPPNVRTLDGPTDVAFTCHGRMRVTQGEAATDAQPIVTSPMAVEACQAWRDVTTKLDDRGTAEESDDRIFLEGLPPAGQGPLDLMPGQRLDNDEETQKELFEEWKAQVNLYGFVLQKNQGTVALLRQGLSNTASVALKDADPFAPGLNVIPVGTQPVGITVDPTGCHVTTANAASCDLSVLDVATVLSEDTVPVVRRRPVQNAAGEIISAQPRAIVGQVGGSPVGFECTSTPDSLVYVAFPDCNAVAAVHTGTGEIRASIVFAADGSAVLGDGNLTCAAATCGGVTTPPVVETPDAGVPDASVPDAGAPDAGAGIAAIDGRPRPVALHMAADGERLYIGAENSPRVTVVELDPASALPTASWSVALQGEVGITSLAATDVIDMGGDIGRTDVKVFGEFRFVYAAATDNTVRVAEVHTQRRECETQTDPRFLHDVTDGQFLSCMPLLDPTTPIDDPTTPRRRVGARSPGIHMPGDARPLDIVFAQAPGLEAAADGALRKPISPTTLIGTFAYISLSTGQVVVANVDDDNYGDVESAEDAVPYIPVDVDLSLALPHQLRDEGSGRRNSRYCAEQGKPEPKEGEDPPEPAYYPLACDDSFTTTTTELAAEGCNYPAGAPQGPPSITAGGTVALSPDYVAESYAGALPKLRNVECNTPFIPEVPPTPAMGNIPAKPGSPAIEATTVAVPELSIMAPDPLREQVFPDLQSVRSLETWSIAWEGALSRPDVIGLDATTRVGFIEVGSDVVLKDGASPFCAMGAEPGDVVSVVGCNPTLGGADCRAGEVCAVVPEVALDEQRGICVPEAREDDFLEACTSFLSSKRRYTIAEAHADRLVLAERKRVLRTTPVDGCSSAAQCAGLYELELLLADDKAPALEAESPASTDRWACEPEPVRSPDLNVCLMTCDGDDDCEADAGWRCSGEGYCVEATLPPAECVESLLRYEVRAGDAFIVSGSVTGVVHDRMADLLTGECVPDPAAGPLATARIPLTAPPCAGDGFTDLLPNPCTTTVSQFEGKDGARDARAIRIRTPAFVTHLVDPLLDPASQGIACELDGAACPAMQAVPPGYTITFTIASGFSALRAATDFRYPIGLVNDPFGDIWIMDQGDVASTVRGQIAKLSPLALALLVLLQ